MDVVSVQHEYGIWGGPDGALVLDFVHALRTPVVATLHTVLAPRRPRSAGSWWSWSHATAATVVMSRPPRTS